MFDPISSQLLQNAPSLPNVSADDLPRLLTEIYTELVTNRVRGVIDTGNEQSIIRLTTIANSYEIMAVTSNDPASAQASAFVAGTAYQILAKSLLEERDFSDNVLNRDHISGDLAAALLFLIAQQLPDAKEAIRRFTTVGDEEPLILRNLSRSLIDLVQENFGSILERAVESLNTTEDKYYPPEIRATVYLYDLLLQGIELLAATILGRDRPARIDSQDTPDILFQRVLEFAVQEYTIDGLEGKYLSTYPGPAHLATLLSNLGQTLLNASILLIPSPDGSNEDMWQSWLNFRAGHKPLLWPNHREAIDKGFHFNGNSAILVLPTGAGKTTISEFKIAATLAAGKQVLFLAPTNALVEQLKTDLSSSLPAEIFDIDEEFDPDLLISTNGLLPALSIMTPEKCLAILNFNATAFDNVGLVIFDECHSLSYESGSFRRAMDGMLVILQISDLLAEVDFLFLSAMIKEPNKFADWIFSLTAKTCLSIDVRWKPSRQARGVVIYKKDEIDAIVRQATNLQHGLDVIATKLKRPLSNNLQSVGQRVLKAKPYALFGLINNWHPEQPEDISIRQLADEAFPLNWELLPSRRVQAKQNGNGISRQLAAASANAGLKTIVFMNNTLWANKSAKDTSLLINDQVTYNNHEARLFAAISEEFGNPECSMLHQQTRCVQHHADLISHERQLAESLFKRDDGAKVIFATTTLSQGMNLPAQVAILSADERASLTGSYVTQEPMRPHELLNAAGRAGRAGYLANGLVILVPRTLLTYTQDGPEPASHSVLHSILPEDERCVEILDPLTKALDHIQTSVPFSADIEYLINRLGATNKDENTGNLFRRSLGYFMATKAGNIQTYEAAISVLTQKMTQEKPDEQTPNWLIQLSIQSGLSLKVLTALHSSIVQQFENLPATVVEWVNWLIDWLIHFDEASRFCFGIEMLPLQTIGGVPRINPNNYAAALDTLKNGMTAWLKGETLSKVEEAMGGTLRGQKIYCPKAREIATNIAPRSLSYFSTFIIQITKKIAEENNFLIPNLAVLESLQSAIAKGADSPEKLAFMQLTKSRYRTRVNAHNDFNPYKYPRKLNILQ